MDQKVESFFEEASKHPYKHLQSSLEAIDRFCAPFKGTIEAPRDSPTHQCNIVLQKDEKSEHFTFTTKPKSFVSLNDASFATLGLDHPLVVKANSGCRYIPFKSICRLSVGLERIHGEISTIGSVPSEQIKNRYVRMIVPVDTEAPTTNIESTSYTDKKTIYGFGLVRLNLNGRVYEMYRYKQPNQQYLIIESLSTTDLDIFETESKCCLEAFALLCGNWYGGGRFILASKDLAFLEIESILFRNTDRSIVSKCAIIDPFNFVQYMRAQGIPAKVSESNFPSKILSNIASKLFEEVDVRRALFLILEGNNSQSSLLKACSYLVAIETIASIVVKHNKTYFKPLKTAAHEKILSDNLRAVIEQFRSKITADEYAILTKKVENFNTPSGIDRILGSFAFYGIKLSERLVKIIKSRNLFLHGKTLEYPSAANPLFEAELTARRLQMLASTLLLKYCGYSGHIKNHAGQLVFDTFKHDVDFKFTEHVYFTI